MKNTIEIAINSSEQFNQTYNKIEKMLKDANFDVRRYTPIQLSLPDPNQIVDLDHKKIVDYLKNEHDFYVRSGGFVSFFCGGFVGSRYDMFVSMTQKLYVAFNIIYSDEYPEIGSLYQKQAMNDLLIEFLESMLDHRYLFGAKLWPVYKEFKKISNSQIKPKDASQLSVQIPTEYVDLINNKAIQTFSENEELRQRLGEMVDMINANQKDYVQGMAELREIVMAGQRKQATQKKPKGKNVHPFEIDDLGAEVENDDASQSLLSNFKNN